MLPPWTISATPDDWPRRAHRGYRIEADPRERPIPGRVSELAQSSSERGLSWGAPAAAIVLSASGGSRAPGQCECSAEEDADRCQSGRSRARKDHGTLRRDAPRVAALIRARLSRVALPDERINENDGHGRGRNGAYDRAPASAHNAGSDETQHRGRERQSAPWRPNARVLVLEVPEQPQGRGDDAREEGCDGPVHCPPATVVPPSRCVGCSVHATRYRVGRPGA